MAHITTAFTTPLVVTWNTAGTNEKCTSSLPKHTVPGSPRKRSIIWIYNSSAGKPGPDGENQSEKPVRKDEDETPQHEIPQSSIDWNKLWADFQESGGQSQAPSGREPTSKQEIARRKVAKGIRNMSNALPARQQLFADWRFWLAIILALSFFTAFVQSTSTTSGVNII